MHVLTRRSRPSGRSFALFCFFFSMFRSTPRSTEENRHRCHSCLGSHVNSASVSARLSLTNPWLFLLDTFRTWSGLVGYFASFGLNELRYMASVFYHRRSGGPLGFFRRSWRRGSCVRRWWHDIFCYFHLSFFIRTESHLCINNIWIPTSITKMVRAL
jgi:hypothetical protein